MPDAQADTVYLLDCSTLERRSIPPGTTGVIVGDDLVLHFVPNLTPAAAQNPRLRAILTRNRDTVELTAFAPDGVSVNKCALRSHAPVALVHSDLVSIGGSFVRVYGCLPPDEVGGFRAPEPGPPEEAVEFQPPEPGTGTATVARLTGPQADPAAASATTSPEFGFEPHEVEFEQQGVGREAASRLAKRFRWIKNLSAGGMGKIILVQEVLSGRFVAMKVMLAAAAANQGMVQQFVREAVITARLQHPHIIPVHDLGFLEGNQLYFTMSYIEGETLKTRMPALDPADRVRVLRCVALAAKHAHDRNLWHRDIKPQNVLVGELGDTYLIDWGIVSVQPGREYKLNIPKVVVDRLSYTIPDNLIRETNEAATGAGGVIGTPAYMAPEAIAGHERLMGAATDVWSVGVMLYEALTDRHPFMVPGMGHYEVMGAVQSETPQRVGELNPAAPSDLIALCDRMLRKNPHERIELPAAIGALTTHLNRNSHTLSITHLLSAHRPPPLTTDGRPQVLDLPRGTTELENELARTRRKCEILLELAQLGPLSIRRRKELWAQLVNL